MAFDQNEYNKQYRKERYSRIEIVVPKGKKLLLQEVAKAKGKTVSRIIIEAVERQYHIDLTIDENLL